MSAIHDEILSSIEQRGLALGVPMAELDRHVADVLGVPPDHYAAWQLVGGAIASYARASGLGEAGPGGWLSPAGAATVAGQLRRLWERLGAMHCAAAAEDGDPTVAREQTRQLIGELFVLTDWLLTCPATTDRVDATDQLHAEVPGVVPHG